MTEKKDEKRLKELLSRFNLTEYKELVNILVRDQERYHKEQLILNGVGRSLPNLETRNIEVKRLTDKIYKKDDYFGKSNFTQGFRAAFVWLRLKPSENG